MSVAEAAVGKMIVKFIVDDTTIILRGEQLYH
jgi:hypothetical protein